MAKDTELWHRDRRIEDLQRELGKVKEELKDANYSNKVLRERVAAMEPEAIKSRSVYWFQKAEKYRIQAGSLEYNLTRAQYRIADLQEQIEELGHAPVLDRQDSDTAGVVNSEEVAMEEALGAE